MTGRRLVTAMLVASVAASACGSPDPPTVLNTEKVERAIERSSMSQRGQRVSVSCPAGVHQEKGAVFSCTTVGERARTRFMVTQLDGSGRVHYEAR